MLKKIFVCVALITCCACFADGFNYEALKNPPANILHVKTDSGSLIWMSKKYYSVKLPQYNCMVFFLSRIIQKDGKASCQIMFSNNREPISELFIKFKDGKATEVGAEKNEEALRELINMDENAGYLGECALVPYSSPIRESGLLFYNTLFDENAACHLALGRGFTNLLKDYENLTEAEAHEKGINDSIVHEDFMIGTSDMSIVATTMDGKEVKIFENGEWAF